MIKTISTLIFFLLLFPALAQEHINREIKQLQKDKFKNDLCLDFINLEDLSENVQGLVQIIIVRHGEPAMEKKGWINRDQAIRYTEMYDSVGVYDFDKKPVCLQPQELDTVYTSKLPRAIDTAEKTLGGEFVIQHEARFNEFERKVIKFPNIKLPRKFWSITTRLVWMMGFNHKGIESFSDAKKRARKSALYLDGKARNNGKTLLFAHGFLNKYVKKYLKKEGYRVLNLDGQKYLGAYYFYKFN